MQRKAASEMLLPPTPPPSFPPEDAVVKPIDELSGVLGEELQEGDEEMEEVEEIDNGGGVGAFLAPARRKMVKKTLLKKASAKNGAVKPETRSSVFAKAGVLSARELSSRALLRNARCLLNKKKMRNLQKEFLEKWV